MLEQSWSARTLTLSRGRIWLRLACCKCRRNIEFQRKPGSCQKLLLTGALVAEGSMVEELRARARTATFLSKSSTRGGLPSRWRKYQKESGTGVDAAMGKGRTCSAVAWVACGHLVFPAEVNEGAQLSCHLDAAPKSRTSTISTSAGPPDATGVGSTNTTGICHPPRFFGRTVNLLVEASGKGVGVENQLPQSSCWCSPIADRGRLVFQTYIPSAQSQPHNCESRSWTLIGAWDADA